MISECAANNKGDSRVGMGGFCGQNFERECINVLLKKIIVMRNNTNWKIT